MRETEQTRKFMVRGNPLVALSMLQVFPTELRELHFSFQFIQINQEVGITNLFMELSKCSNIA